MLHLLLRIIILQKSIIWFCISYKSIFILLLPSFHHNLSHFPFREKSKATENYANPHIFKNKLFSNQNKSSHFSNRKYSRTSILIRRTGSSLWNLRYGTVGRSFIMGDLILGGVFNIFFNFVKIYYRNRGTELSTTFWRGKSYIRGRRRGEKIDLL